MKLNHLCLLRLIFLKFREIEGVGRLNSKLLGFQSYFFYSLSCFLGEIVYDVLGSICSGNFAIGSPCPLLAGLKAAS
jgi:hypothetical protein